MALEIDRTGISEHEVGEERRLDIIGGSYLGSGLLTNKDIEKRGIITPSGKHLTEREILKKTDIYQRFRASAQETPFFMLQAATEVAVGNSTDVDVLLVSTSFPTGENSAERLRDTFGFKTTYHSDAHAACSGVPFMFSYLKANEERVEGARVVLGTMDKYSDKVVHLRSDNLHEDPSMGEFTFSDGSFVVTFQYGEDLRVVAYTNRAFPNHVSSYLKMPVDISKARPPALYIPIPYSDKFRQNGRKVYEIVQENVPDMVRYTVKKSGFEPKDIKEVFIHQGTGHMSKGIGKRLPEYTVTYDVNDGNFSAGSILKTFLSALHGEEISVMKNGELTRERMKLQKGDVVVFAGFGAGLFASVAVVQL